MREEEMRGGREERERGRESTTVTWREEANTKIKLSILPFKR